jgi:hypothetical protein
MNYSVFTSHYFTDWILTATTLVSFVISLTHREHKQLFLIRLYIGASLFIDILFTVAELLYSTNKLCVEIGDVILNLYSILEISLLSLFIRNAVKRKKFRRLIKTLCNFYILFSISVWIYFPTAITSNLHYLFAVEGIFITAFSLVYFYEIIHSGFLTRISKDPKFIVISGILFYFSTSVPYYFSSYDLLQVSLNSFMIYDSINYAFYTVLFLTFIKACLCPVLIQK